MFVVNYIVFYSVVCDFRKRICNLNSEESVAMREQECVFATTPNGTDRHSHIVLLI